MKKNCILLLVVTAVICCICFSSCSEAKGEFSNLKSKSDVRLVNDSLDYGIDVSFTVKNVGKKGTITITPRLSCSEGEWTREQTLTFDEGESKTFTYFFQEPTINAENIYSSVKLFP